MFIFNEKINIYLWWNMSMVKTPHPIIEKLTKIIKQKKSIKNLSKNWKKWLIIVLKNPAYYWVIPSHTRACARATSSLLFSSPIENLYVPSPKLHHPFSKPNPLSFDFISPVVSPEKKNRNSRRERRTKDLNNNGQRRTWEDIIKGRRRSHGYRFLLVLHWWASRFEKTSDSVSLPSD